MGKEYTMEDVQRLQKTTKEIQEVQKALDTFFREIEGPLQKLLKTLEKHQ